MKTTDLQFSEAGSLVAGPQSKAGIFTVSAVAALGGLLFGFDTAVISGAIPSITNYFRLNDYSLGWAIGAVLIGCAIGAMFAGRLADHAGRRFALLVCAFLFAGSGLGAGFSHTLTEFIIFRLVGGLGVGAAAMVSPMYIAEIAPPDWRGRLVSLYQLAIVLGILGAYMSNYALAGIGENSWRWMFASQAAPSVLFAILLQFVPETPRWLTGQNRKEEAMFVLIEMNGSQEAVLQMKQIEQSFADPKKVGIKEVWARIHRPALFTGIILAVIQQVTGINAIIYYAPVIFSQIGGGASSPLLQTIVIGIVNVFATCIAIGLVDKWGRRRLLVTGCIVMGITLVAVGLCFQLQYFDHFIVLICMLLYVTAFGCTLGAVIWVYLSEMFPNRIRAAGLSIATLALWLADFAVTYTFPVLSRKAGISVTMYLYAFFCSIAFVYVFFKVPETKGRSLEDTDSLFVR